MYHHDGHGDTSLKVWIQAFGRLHWDQHCSDPDSLQQGYAIRFLGKPHVWGRRLLPGHSLCPSAPSNPNPPVSSGLKSIKSNRHDGFFWEEI